MSVGFKLHQVVDKHQFLLQDDSIYAAGGLVENIGSWSINDKFPALPEPIAAISSSSYYSHTDMGGLPVVMCLALRSPTDCDTLL